MLCESMCSVFVTERAFFHTKVAKNDNPKKAAGRNKLNFEERLQTDSVIWGGKNKRTNFNKT